jgi:hypothetical protein
MEAKGRKGEEKGEEESWTYHVDDTRGDPSAVSIDNLGVLASNSEILTNLDDKTLVEQKIMVEENLGAVVLARPDSSVANEGGGRSLVVVKGQYSE